MHTQTLYCHNCQRGAVLMHLPNHLYKSTTEDWFNKHKNCEAT